MRQARGYAILVLLVLTILPMATMRGAGSEDDATGALKSIVISPGDPQVKVTESVTFTATGLDEKGKPVDLQHVNWTLADLSYGEITEKNDTAADLNAGTKAGEVKVIADCSKISANVTVKVLPGDAVEMKIAPATATVKVTGGVAFVASAKDEFGNVVPQGSYTWTSASLLIGTFRSQHVARSVFVAGTLIGSTKVTVEAGAAKATATVIVQPGALYSVRIFPNEIDVDSMDTATFQAYSCDIYGNEIPGEKNFTWLISHSFARIVNSTGDKVTVSIGEIGGGSETITATLGENLSARATVRVRPAIWFISTASIAFLTVLITFLVRYKTRTRCPECGAPHWTFAEKCKVCETPMHERIPEK
jgi:hypothetical protein